MPSADKEEPAEVEMEEPLMVEAEDKESDGMGDVSPEVEDQKTEGIPFEPPQVDESSTDDNKGQLIYFMGMDKVRFRKPVVPGDQLLFEAKITKMRTRVAKMTWTACVDN